MKLKMLHSAILLLAVAGGLKIVSFAQAQYVLGNGVSAGITMSSGSFPGSPTTTANGLTLTVPTVPGYQWGEWNIPTAQQQHYNPNDNTIIFQYTILSPAPGTTGADYTDGAAWTWYSLQPLLGDTSGGSYNPVRYFGYDGYNLSYAFPNGQNIGNEDPGYVYNPTNQQVTITAPLSAAQQAAIAGGASIAFFQISFDPTSTLPDGYSVQINSIELVAEPSAPIITTQPASQIAQVGSNATFTVIASGAPSPTFQWQFDGQNIPDATKTNLLLTNVQFANAGGYSVIGTNAYGSVTSAVAQLTVFTNLVVAQTNQVPPPPGNPTIPTDPTQFKVFTNGVFETGIGLDPTKSTIVLTHGWNESSSGWPLEMANNIKLELGANTPNIVAWDWTAVAEGSLHSAASQTLGQGYALGTDLVAALGSNYSQRIHFMGHSLGTMVNAKAANVVEGLGWSWTNIQMTLFDEASVESGILADSWQTATTLLQNDVNPNLTLQPVLPAQFAWADNYITAFGLIHTDAVNVILTNSYPIIDNSVIGDIANVIWKNFLTEDIAYHNYSYVWYFNTVNQINNPNDPPYPMGFVRSWEGGGTAGRPAPNTYYIESTNCPPSFLTYSGYDPTYNLVEITSNQASLFLNNRLNTILPSQLVSAVGASQNILANAPNQVQAMIESGQILDPAADAESLLQYAGATLVQFGTTQLLGSLVVKGTAQPEGGPVPDGSGGNSPAYVWITLSVPSNAVAMSFDFMLQGNGNQDSFQAALNNQNIFTLETVLIQTNVGMNSGLIDVSQYAGTNVQLFLGIVGGTSTNATMTVGNILFYSEAPPVLQIQMAGTNVVLTWPLWAANYALETTASLGATNSWTIVTNAPSIANSECSITNQISGGISYYRLAIIAAPTLQAQISSSNIILSWPSSSQNFSLQTTTNLADPNSWMTLTNVPAIMNLQNTITNPISGYQGFYRLIQSQ
jgi:pimeloyl-ACP methyl ester carboxylesterase